jgi:hypothetical protein
MKAVTVSGIRQELENLAPKELRVMILRLARFKKENKELITYLLYEASDESSYIENVKLEIDQQFELINKKNYYLIKKSIRKILAFTRKNIRYSLKKETEVELLIYFCKKLAEFKPSIKKSSALTNLFIRLIETTRKKMSVLHEDLQFDYGLELNSLSDKIKAA